MLEYPNGCKDSTLPRELQISDKETATSPAIQLSSLYENSNISIETAERRGCHYHLYGRSTTQYGVCPYCGRISNRIHSRYTRTIRDLSILGVGVIIHFRTRKFFCEEEECLHKTFAEQPGNEIFRYRRRTRRCEVLVAQQSSCCSSNQARKQLSAMNVPLSSGTILRDLHRITIPDAPAVKKIGIDDWAFRKGISYGSIIVNLETGGFLTLLEDRNLSSFKSWLEQHPDISIVSRDRSTDYSAAIAATGRDIVEVADRFHLIKNLSEKISKLISERYADYKALIRPVTPELSGKADKETPLLLPASKKEDKRQIYFKAVKDLHSKGLSISKIAKRVGISKPTIIKYIRLDSLPQRSHSTRNAYHLYEQRVTHEYLVEGRSLVHIWEKLVSEGAKFGKTPFEVHFRYLAEEKRKAMLQCREEKDRAKREELIEEMKAPLLSPIMMSSITDKYIRGKNLKLQETEFIATMRKLPWFVEICAYAKEFYEIIKNFDLEKFRQWLKGNENSSISYIRSFIYGLKQDIDAVENALKYPISNGILEGHVNKLKTIKRTMYGRAGLKLLAVKLFLAEDVFFN